MALGDKEAIEDRHGLGKEIGVRGFFLERKTSESPQLQTKSNFWGYSCTKGIFGFGRFKNLFRNFEIVFG